MNSNLDQQDEHNLEERIQSEEPGEDSEQQAALEKIKIMLDREQSLYSIQDYEASSQNPSRPFSCFVTPDDRKRMVQWCITMVDYLQLRRETVERAINCVDRFVFRSGGQILLSDIIIYQRAIITALYTMIKCHEEEVIPIEEMADACSRSRDDENDGTDENELDHTAEQLAAMEIVLLTELQWLISAPTSEEYIVQFLKLLNLRTDAYGGGNDSYDQRIETSSGESIAETNWLLELASFEVEESLQHYDCWKKGAFHNAYEAILNALPMITGGEAMRERLHAILLSEVPGIEQYWSPGSTSNVSIDVISTPKIFPNDSVEREGVSRLRRTVSSDSGDFEWSMSSASSTPTSDSSILAEEDDQVEILIEGQEVFVSRDDIVPLGDAKIGVDDYESPACVMDRVLSKVTQHALVENNSELLAVDDKCQQPDVY